MRQKLDIQEFRECSGEHSHGYPQILVPLQQSMSIQVGEEEYDVTCVGRSQSSGGLRLGQPWLQKPGHETLDPQIDVKKNKNKCVVYAAVFGEELQQCIVFSQQRWYNG